MAKLYEIARIGSECVDGRSNHGAWGYETTFHANASRPRGQSRLRDGGHWGCSAARHTPSSSGRVPITRTTPSASRSGDGPAGRPTWPSRPFAPGRRKDVMAEPKVGGGLGALI